MKRMSELKDNLRGVKCDATKEAFRFLKKAKRKPYVGETPTACYIRVQIDGQRYDYYAASGSWAVTRVRGKPGRWLKASSVADFYSAAMEKSAIRNSDEATEKQKGYIASLLEQTGAEPTEFATESKQGAMEEIERLLKIKAAQTKGFYKHSDSVAQPEKPRLSPIEQRVFMAMLDCLKTGDMTGRKAVAERISVTEEQFNNAADKLRSSGLLLGMARHAWPVRNESRVH